jgi:hypothetical protein
MNSQLPFDRDAAKLLIGKSIRLFRNGKLYDEGELGELCGNLALRRTDGTTAIVAVPRFGGWILTHEEI